MLSIETTGVITVPSVLFRNSQPRLEDSQAARHLQTDRGDVKSTQYIIVSGWCPLSQSRGKVCENL
jgi:hypothetical protein